MCPLTVGGSFEAKTSSVSGQLAVDPAQPSRLTGEIAVDLKTLDTGISLRNTHMRDNYLEVGKGDGFDRAVLSDIVVKGDAATVTGATTFTATLLVHGTRKPVSGQVRIARAGTRRPRRRQFSREPFRLRHPRAALPRRRRQGTGASEGQVRECSMTAVALRAGLAVGLVGVLASAASAEPKFLSKQYTRCTTCHVSPTGGGLLSAYGRSLSHRELSTTGAPMPSHGEMESEAGRGVVPLGRARRVARASAARHRGCGRRSCTTRSSTPARTATC